jgi:hypothetical protein
MLIMDINRRILNRRIMNAVGTNGEPTLICNGKKINPTAWFYAHC